MESNYLYAAMSAAFMSFLLHGVVVPPKVQVAGIDDDAFLLRIDGVNYRTGRIKSLKAWEVGVSAETPPQTTAPPAVRGAWLMPFAKSYCLVFVDGEVCVGVRSDAFVRRGVDRGR